MNDTSSAINANTVFYVDVISQCEYQLLVFMFMLSVDAEVGGGYAGGGGL